MRRSLSLLLIAAGSLGWMVLGSQASFTSWTLEEAVKLLNDSPWGKQTTYTRVIGGVGSGILGEKEIYNTYYTRLLSARPIRQAFARIQQINHNYDELDQEQKRRFDELVRPGLNLDVRRWIVVSLSFRSNDPSWETRVDRFLRSSSVEGLKRRAFLSTASHPRVDLEAYHAPKGDGSGAKFVFPRTVGTTEVVSPEDSILTFELDVPGEPDLSVSFLTQEMRVEGELVL